MNISEMRLKADALVERARSIPLQYALGVGAVALGALLYFGISLSGPSYTPLFQGLSPAAGGQVIADLQKLGIPYALKSNGTIIEVPSSDVGRARLELGTKGLPSRSGQSDWAKLESLPMTASQTATQATLDMAVNQSLKASIESVSGARHVRVMIARPQHTPFLGDQPKTTASVVLVDAPGADFDIGQAVAKLVAASIPGLKQQSVVVEKSGGDILYPAEKNHTVRTQMGVQDSIESSQKERIQSLLDPIFGHGNYRVSVDASVDFSNKAINSVVYGPSSYPVSEDTSSRKRIGSTTAAIGIPGALSNQPPGPTTAPVTAPPAATGAQTGAASTKKPGPPTPSSTSKSKKQTFAVSKTTTMTRPASWRLKRLAISVVLNAPAVPKGLTAAEVKAMVVGAIAAPKASVVVATANFTAPGKQVMVKPPAPVVSNLIQAALIVIGSLALLFGVVLPLGKFLSGAVVATPEALRVEAAGSSGVISAGSGPDTKRAVEEAKSRVVEAVDREPAAVARVLQKWLEQG